MRKVVLLTAAIALLATPAVLAQAAMAGSAHDMSASASGGQLCVFCHTPHQPTGTTTDPLWNHTLSTNANYGVYASDTFDATETITDIGGGSTVSNLCMSCHDELEIVYNPGGGTFQ